MKKYIINKNKMSNTPSGASTLNPSEANSDNENGVTKQDIENYFLNNCNKNNITERLNFLYGLQTKINEQAKKLEHIVEDAEKNSQEKDSKYGYSEDEEGGDIELFNPPSEDNDNNPIEYSLISENEIGEEQNNDNLLLSSEADTHIEEKDNIINPEDTINVEVDNSNTDNMKIDSGDNKTVNGEQETKPKTRRRRTTKTKSTTAKAEKTKTTAKRPGRKKKNPEPVEPVEPVESNESMEHDESDETEVKDYDDDMEDFVDESAKSTKKTRRTRKATTSKPKEKGKRVDEDTFFPPAEKFKRVKINCNIQELCDLAKTYPDTYWENNGENGEMINFINEDYPLEIVPESSIRDFSQIVGIELSPDGQMLATFSTVGYTKIWDTDTFELIQTLKDEDEEQIDEFFVGRFTPSMEHIVVAGKLKDRKKWSLEDDDNHILPCPLKVFDVVTGKVINRLEGHTEEVLCIKSLTFKNENYYITTSQDGYIIKWKMKNGWTELDHYTKMNDGITCMAFTVSFLPHTGNKYFIAATDGDISLYDFENANLLQRFESPYSHYCDCVKIVDCLEFPRPDNIWGVTDEMPTKDSPMFCYFVTRGVEVLDAEDDTVPSKPNRCHLEKLVYPVNESDHFKIEDINYYEDNSYHSNSWLIKLTSNGRYIVAPTYDGKLCIFNLLSGKLVGTLSYHDTVEVRDVVFHPYKPLLFSCSDDGTVKVYKSVKK